MKSICIIAPMLNSLEKLDELNENVKQICRDKYDFLVFVFHKDKVLPKWKRNKNFKFIKAEYASSFDDCIENGVQFVDKDVLIILDTNDKNVYKNMSNALIKWENGADIVLLKKRKETKNIFRKAFDWIYQKMLKLAKLDEENFSYNNFGLFNKNVVNLMKQFPQKNYYFRHFNCFEDYKVEFLDYEKTKRIKSGYSVINQYFILYMLSFVLALANILLLIFTTKFVKFENQPIFTMIGITLIFAGVLFGVYNFHIWLLQRRTKLPL